MIPPGNTSRASIIDVTAHSICLSQNEQPNDINDIFIRQTSISISESIVVQADELSNCIIQVCQYIGEINGEKVLGLEPILNYISDNSFSKDDPAINEHHCHMTKRQYNK